jgi:toxin ParE1/3/4
MTRKYHVDISAAAENDVRRYRAYIAKDKPRAAARWVRDFRRLARSLAHLPLRCEVIPEAEEMPVDYRHLLFGNYRIIFQVEGDTVTILRVVHAAQQLDASFFEQL